MPVKEIPDRSGNPFRLEGNEEIKRIYQLSLSPQSPLQ